MVHKFKNNRKRKALDSPLLQEQRKAKKCDSGKSSGMPGYNPSCSGSNPIETARLMNKLKQETDPEESTTLMAKLFPERRRLIVSKKRPITEIKEQFPALFTSSGVS